MSFDDFFYDAIIGDGEYADVEGVLGFRNESTDTVQAVFAGAEVSVGFDFIFTCVDELDDSLEPLHGCDFTDF